MKFGFLSIFVTFMLSGCLSSNDGTNEPDGYRLLPYQETSLYSASLAACVNPKSSSEACSFEKLPTMGMEFNSISSAKISQRLVVSHSWMGDNFIKFIDTFPDEYLSLFKSVTAVVISADIRPSFASGETGAIYIDPRYLWLSADEANTIEQKSDFRSGFGDQLSYLGIWRYVKNDLYAYRSYSLDSASQRDVNDALLRFVRLMVHELAHVNDYFPNSEMALVDRRKKPADIALELYNKSLSYKLSADYPLTSVELIELAKVNFRGSTPSAEQKGMLADYVGALFANDGANDHYSYNSISEDVAMLFEESVMSIEFGVERDIAFTSMPSDNTNCDEYLVGWGTRNRIGNTLVKPRAKLVASNLMPTKDWGVFFQNITMSTSMVVGDSWCENLSLYSSTTMQKAFSTKSDISAIQLDTDRLAPHY